MFFEFLNSTKLSDVAALIKILKPFKEFLHGIWSL